MARRAVLVEASSTMRNILASIIMAHHNDVSIIGAHDYAETREILSRQQVQMIVYNWDGVSADHYELLREAEEKAVPVLVLVPDFNSPIVNELLAANLPESHICPLNEGALAGAIDRVCDPRGLRTSRRYCIPGAMARLTQGGTTFFGLVINVSTGGMLCDIEYAESFHWDAATAIELDIPAAGNGTATIGGISGGVRRLAVLECEEDGRPVLLRLAYAFAPLPSAVAEVLLRTLTHSASSTILAS